MNTLGGALEFEYDIKLEKFEKKLASIEGQLKQMTGSIETQTSKIDDSYKKLAAGIAAYFSFETLKGFGSQLIEVRGQFEQLGIAFTTMLGSKDKADELMARITDLAAKTPFSLADVASATKKLIAFGESSETVTDTITRLGNIASGTGADMGELVAAYGKVMSKGKMQAEELNQFTERGIPLVAELAKQFNTNNEGVYDLVSKGKVGFAELQTVIKGMTDEGGKFFNLMEKQSKSVTGMISNMGDAWDRMLNDVGESNEGILKGSIEGVTYLIEHYQEVLKVIGSLIAAYGTYKAAVIILAATEKIRYQITLAQMTAENGMSKARALQLVLTGKLKDAQELLNKSILKNPYALAAAAVVGLITAFIALKEEQTDVSKGFAEFNTNLQSESSKMNALFETIKTAKDGSEERKKAIKELNEIYKDYLPNQISEKDNLKQISLIQDEANKALRTNIALKAQQNDIEKAQSESLLKQKKYADYILNSVTDKKGAAVAVGALQDFNSLVDDWVASINEKDAKAYDALGKKINTSAEEFAKKYGIGSRTVMDKVMYSAWIKVREAEELSKINTFYQKYIENVQKAGQVSATILPKYKTVADRIKEIDTQISDLQAKRSQTALKDTAARTEIDIQIAKLDKEKSDLMGKKTTGSTKDIDAMAGSVADLTEKIKKLNEEKDKSDSPARRAAIDEQTKAYQKQIDTLNAGTQRILDNEYFKNQISPVKNDKLNGISVLNLGENNKPVQSADPIYKWYAEDQVKEYEKSFKVIEKLSRDQLKKEIANSKLDLINYQNDAKKKEEKLKYLNDLENTLTDKTYTNVMDTAEAVRVLGQSIGGDLGNMLGLLGDGVQGIQNGIKDIQAPGATFGQQALGAASIFSSMYSIAKGLEAADQKVYQEEQQKYYETQQRYISNVTKLIELQIDALKELRGEEKITNRETVISQLTADSEDLVNKAKSNVRIFQGLEFYQKWTWLGYVTKSRERFADLSKLSIDQLREIRDAYIKGDNESIMKTYGGVLRDDDFKVLDEYVTKYDETMQKIKNIQNDMYAELTGSTYDSILSSIVDAFSDGTMSAEEFGNNFNEIMKKSLLNAFSRQFLEKQMQTWYEEFYDASKSGGELTTDEVLALRNSLKTITDGAQAGLNTLTQIAGIDFTGQTTSNQSALAGAVKGMTEDSANLIAGQFNGMRLTLIDQKNLAMEGLNNLIKIEYNTRQTANNTERIAKAVESNNSLNSDRANGF